ncbi:hypothetical protein BDZ45DRAFT_371658 [Acephala macrosclerotiorum]|nr:hypothetical protein BDZ45DRAFT_371658 [Acephala macrosclerotiorum]
METGKSTGFISTVRDTSVNGGLNDDSSLFETHLGTAALRDPFWDIPDIPARDDGNLFEGDDKGPLSIQKPDVPTFPIFPKGERHAVHNRTPATPELSPGVNRIHAFNNDRKAPKALISETRRPLILGSSAQFDVSKHYPSPMSNMSTSPMSSVTISTTPASTPMSSVNISTTPRSLLDETTSHRSSSTSIIEKSFNSIGSMRSNYTDDSACASMRTTFVAASPDSDFESSQSDDESILGDKVTTRIPGSKRKRTRLYIHVEDLMSYVRKKRRTNIPGNCPQVSQVPSSDTTQPGQIPSVLTPVNSNLATGSAPMERDPHILDAHNQNQFEVNNSKPATDQSSDISASDSGGDNDSGDDDEDDFTLESDLRQQSLEFFHLLGLDASDLAQYTTDSSSGSGSGIGSGNSITVGSSKATPSSGTTGSFGSWTPRSQPGAEKEPKSPGDNIVAVGSSGTPPKLVFGPLELRCWHAAYGFRCPGKTGRSPDVRHLMDDHSYSKKSSNHHKLPPKCQRCDRLFENENSSEQHRNKLKSDAPCDILPPKELESINSELNRKGISPDRKNEIDTALRNFSKNKTLPLSCNRTEFHAWIARNRPIHIGRSDRSESIAERELGKWFVVWYTLFPDKEIPYHPFDDGGLDPKKCERILDLSMSNILQDSTKRLLPELNQEHLDRIRQHFRNGLEIQWLELLQDHSTTQKAKKSRGRIGSSTPNPSPPWSMVSPGPKHPNFFPPDYPGSATFKQPSPGGVMGPPPSPAPDS